MCKQAKLLLVIVPICFLLAGLSVLLFMLDPEFEANSYIISSMVLVTLWAFFVAPSLPFAISWLKHYFENITESEAFRLGYYLGRGWGVLAFLLFLIVSPITGTMWFIRTFKALRKIDNCKSKQPESMSDEKDIFNL